MGQKLMFQVIKLKTYFEINKRLRKIFAHLTPAALFSCVEPAIFALAPICNQRVHQRFSAPIANRRERNFPNFQLSIFNFQFFPLPLCDKIETMIKSDALRQTKMTGYRWVICAMLFFATTVNYLDRQVLSLLVPDQVEYVSGNPVVKLQGIQNEFHWSNTDYGEITAFFSLFYALCMLFAGRIVDWLGTRKGYLWSIGIWSVGACLHAFCGIATAGVVKGNWLVGFAASKEILLGVPDVALIAGTSMILFMVARAILALGEAGNFPAAIKATAEYFPKKDRAFSTSIFNSGATIGAMLAPMSIIPLILFVRSWEWVFMIIGALGFIWMGFWLFIYKKPHENPRVNKAELDYILSDSEESAKEDVVTKEKVSFIECFKHRQTWSFAFGKFITDGVWWFMLFWLPKYLSETYKLSTDLDRILPLTVLYAIVMISLYGGKLPTIIINKTGLDPYAARMRAMLIFAFFPLLILLAQPLGYYFHTYWIPVVLLGIGAAAHQSWSANIFSTVGDMFPKKAIATITGIGGMAGGIGSAIINFGSGSLQDFAQQTGMRFMGFEGKPAAYYMIFCFCAVAYLIGWVVMKRLVPKYKFVTM